MCDDTIRIHEISIFKVYYPNGQRTTPERVLDRLLDEYYPDESNRVKLFSSGLSHLYRYDFDLSSLGTRVHIGYSGINHENMG